MDDGYWIVNAPCILHLASRIVYHVSCIMYHSMHQASCITHDSLRIMHHASLATIRNYSAVESELFATVPLLFEVIHQYSQPYATIRCYSVSMSPLFAAILIQNDYPNGNLHMPDGPERKQSGRQLRGQHVGVDGGLMQVPNSTSALGVLYSIHLSLRHFCTGLLGNVVNPPALITTLISGYICDSNRSNNTHRWIYTTLYCKYVA